MSIAALLQAAEYLERREREAEHGYASTMPMPDDFIAHRRTKTKKSQGNRRAHMRECLDILKEVVPLGPDASRHTTLGLLTRTKSFIKNLEGQERKQIVQREQLYREHRYLKRRLEQLNIQLFAIRKRSVSECSTSTSSTSSTSETDEVDIMGYNSNQSDIDDHSSIQSMNSDGGMVINTRRLTLQETFFDH